MIASIFEKLNSNVSFSIICIAAIIIFAYALNETSQRCMQAYSIGHSHDTEAVVFSNLSFISYMVAIIMTVVILTGTLVRAGNPYARQLVTEMNMYESEELYVKEEDLLWKENDKQDIKNHEKEGMLDILPNAISEASEQLTKSTSELIETDILEY